MYILLYVKIILCNAIPYIYFQLEWGYIYAQYMCILIYVIVIWCNGYFRDLLSIGLGGLMYAQYMCILLNVTLIWCNSISEIYCQLDWGV